MRFFSASLLTLLVSLPAVLSAPVEEASHVLEARQQGISKGSYPPGTSWTPTRTWSDSTVKQPNTFDAIPLEGCSFDLTFKRDSTDTKYELGYYSVFGEGEVQRSEFLNTVNLRFTGTVDADGRRTYTAFVQNACSTFYTDRRRPRAFQIYLTPRTGEKRKGYYSPLFV